MDAPCPLLRLFRPQVQLSYEETARKRKLVMKRIVLLAMLWVGVACSNGPAPVADVHQVQARDLAFDQTQLAVPAGAEVTVNLSNVGSLEHNWVLVQDGTDPATATPADAINAAASEILAGGKSTSLTFTAPAVGSYQYICTVPGHALAGMVGTLTVVP